MNYQPGEVVLFEGEPFVVRGLWGEGDFLFVNLDGRERRGSVRAADLQPLLPHEGLLPEPGQRWDHKTYGELIAAGVSKDHAGFFEFAWAADPGELGAEYSWVVLARCIREGFLFCVDEDRWVAPSCNFSRRCAEFGGTLDCPQGCRFCVRGGCWHPAGWPSGDGRERVQRLNEHDNDAQALDDLRVRLAKEIFVKRCQKIISSTVDDALKPSPPPEPHKWGGIDFSPCDEHLISQATSTPSASPMEGGRGLGVFEARFSFPVSVPSHPTETWTATFVGIDGSEYEIPGPKEAGWRAHAPGEEKPSPGPHLLVFDGGLWDAPEVAFSRRSLSAGDGWEIISKAKQHPAWGYVQTQWGRSLFLVAHPEGICWGHDMIPIMESKRVKLTSLTRWLYTPPAPPEDPEPPILSALRRER